jgi:hypothetical protein
MSGLSKQLQLPRIPLYKFSGDIMTDEDPITDEELEETGVDGEEDADDVEEALESDEVSYSAKTKVVETEALEDFSIASRQKARDELEAQIAAFLARGGKINEVPANVTADPPKKPTPDYGGRPI